MSNHRHTTGVPDLRMKRNIITVPGATAYSSGTQFDYTLFDDCPEYRGEGRKCSFLQLYTKNRNDLEAIKNAEPGSLWGLQFRAFARSEPNVANTSFLEHIDRQLFRFRNDPGPCQCWPFGCGKEGFFPEALLPRFDWHVYRLTVWHRIIIDGAVYEFEAPLCVGYSC